MFGRRSVCQVAHPALPLRLFGALVRSSTDLWRETATRFATEGSSSVAKATSTARTMAIQRVESTLIMVETDEAHSDEEWDEFLKLLADNRDELPKLRLLVMTTGGAPNTAQRKRLQATLGGTPMRVAVVSDSIKMRFIASTIALFHRDHRSFTTSELEEAYEHLNLAAGERRKVESVVREMQRTLLRRESVPPAAR